MKKEWKVPREWKFDNTGAINHLLRIPGTTNQKYGKEVIVCQSSKIQYGQEELSKYLQINQPTNVDIEKTESSNQNSEIVTKVPETTKVKKP